MSEPSTIRTVIEPITVPPLCSYCEGTGWFTETVEDATGRGVEIDYTCGACDGTGQEQ
jgi:DnaJ-class molecular chaperone